MRFTLSFDMDNAAFDPRPEPEIANVLRRLADTVLHTGTSPEHGPIRDTNGNTIGVWIVDEGDRSDE